MDLYKQQILDHFKNPRNFGILKDADVSIEETNASCGDRIEIFIKFQPPATSHPGGTPRIPFRPMPCRDQPPVIKDLRFNGVGCAISIAAASMLTEFIKGKSVTEIEKMDKDDIFKLLGIKVGPGRLRCVTLALMAIKKGINIYEKNK